jgi:hypothetical protein
MKKSLSILISIAFISASLLVPAHAAVKPGVKCTVKGQIKNSQGKKFTCIKSGNKLIWNKGIVIVKRENPNPTQSTKSPSSQKPTEETIPVVIRDPNLPEQNTTCTPSSENSFGYQKDGNLVYLQCRNNGSAYFWVSTPGTVNAFRSIPGTNQPALGSDPREKILFSAFEKITFEKKPSSLNFNYFIDPKFSSKYENLIKTGSSEFSQVFGGYFTQRKNFYVVMINDRAYGEKIFADFASKAIFSPALMQNQTSNLIRYIDQRTNPQTSSAYATHENTENALLVYISNPELNIDSWKIGGVFHETYHQLQFDLISNQTAVLPCWIVEGQPNLIALALGFDLYGPEATYTLLRQMASNSRNSNPDISRLEGASGRVYGSYCGNIGEYEQGAIANAYLISKYGFDKAIQIYKTANSARPFSDDWTRIFKEIIGITPEEFYEEVKLYVQWFFEFYLK